MISQKTTRPIALNFDGDAGTKWLMLSYAHLEKV